MERFEVELDNDDGYYDDGPARYRICNKYFGKPGTNLFKLWIVFSLTFVFVIAQFAGALAANSLAMMGDCITMMVDCITYIMNIYSEVTKRQYEGTSIPDSARQLERRVALISGFSLLAVTIYIMYDAAWRLTHESTVDDVNPTIMLVFTIINLLINIVGCAAFFNISIWNCLRCCKSNEGKIGDMQIENEEEKPEESNINMASAFVHLMADTMRTLTVLAGSLFILVSHYDSITVDAISSLVVCTLIIFAVLFLFAEICCQAGDTYSEVEDDLSSAIV